MYRKRVYRLRCQRSVWYWTPQKLGSAFKSLCGGYVCSSLLILCYSLKCAQAHNFSPSLHSIRKETVPNSHSNFVLCIPFLDIKVLFGLHCRACFGTFSSCVPSRWFIQRCLYSKSHQLLWLCSSSCNLKPRKHKVLEIVSLSVRRWGEGDTYSIGSLRKSELLLLDNPRHIRHSYITPKTRLSRREITGKYAARLPAHSMTWHSLHRFRSWAFGFH
jgi:hypothetical protein